MISPPSTTQEYLIFRALVRMIETNTGVGFANGDQGHLAYMMGARDGTPEGMGDSPEDSELFKLLRSFDKRFHDDGPDLSTWQKFCAFAVEAHKRARNGA